MTGHPKTVAAGSEGIGVAARPQATRPGTSVRLVLVGLGAVVFLVTILNAWSRAEQRPRQSGTGSIPWRAGSPTPEPLPSPTPTPTPLPTPEISLTNPSPYGGNQPLASGSTFRIVASVDHPYLIKGVDIEIASASGASVSLGKANQVGRGHTFEALWNLESGPAPGSEEGPVPDGTYTVGARIRGTAMIAKGTVQVIRAPADAMSSVPEWVEIRSPVNGLSASFTEDILRDVTISGVASPGAEGLDLFYSIALHAKPTRWESAQCGYVDLLGIGSAPQSWSGTCRLASTHRPEQVTALAVVTYDCQVAGCDARPGAMAGFRARGGREGGDAVRIYGCWGEPCMAMTPQLWRAKVDTCQRFVLDVSTLEGIKPEGVNLDVHLQGPGKDPRFCDIAGQTPRLAPDQDHDGRWRGHPESVHREEAGNVHHMETATNARGRVVFGITSKVSSFASIYDQFERGHSVVEAWIDKSDNDIPDEGEDIHRAHLHWDLPGRCTMVGTRGDDTIYANAFPNKICALGGNDVIHGLDGATGDDVILAGRGDDTVYGNRGNDRIWAGPGNDRISGGPGDDRIVATEGKNKVECGPGKDVVITNRKSKVAKDCERVIQR